MNKKTPPIILIVNDDGYQAKGLAALVEATKELGEIYVVAPDGVRSGMSHAVTFNMPLRISHLNSVENVHYYKTNGTPVDCVKLGQKVILKNRKIDLILSGINHGSNSSISLIYSGTVAAAIEGSIENYPSIGFSFLNDSASADFTTPKYYAKKIVEKILQNPLPPFTALNVNFPDIPLSEVKGMKITRQTKGYWQQELIEYKDPNNNSYYWANGYLVDQDEKKDSCEWALKNHFVSIQPLQFDLTAYQHIEKLNFFEK